MDKKYLKNQMTPDVNKHDTIVKNKSISTQALI